MLVTDRDGGELAGRVAETIEGAASAACDIADDAAVGRPWPRRWSASAVSTCW